ncbi:type IV pilus assembly protein PilB [Desulfitispora alkaliphila]|uniref:GspE/PulE family protein n=1 Tax=Desulfitispora alkaliphila TaxID=622674 RepID=UPI003D24BDD0
MAKWKREKKRLGDILIDGGVITELQLKEALKTQKQTGLRLGHALIQLGLVTEEQIDEVLEIQLGLPRIALHKMRLNPKIVKLITGTVARNYKVIPFEKVENKLGLAMADPLNLDAIDNIEMQTGLTVEPAIASEREVDQAISRFFGLSDSVEQAFGKELEEMEKEELTTATLDLDELLNATDEAPIVKAVNAIIHQSIKEKASDIHIEAIEKHVRVRYRIDGILQEMIHLPIKTHAALVSRIKIMANMDIAEKRRPHDGRIQIKVAKKSIDLRISTLPTVYGEKVVIRILDKSDALFTIDQLGMQKSVQERFEKMLKQTFGIILITGPTGSGKTTTLYAALNSINEVGVNTVTVEDPVEYMLEGINQVQVNTKAGLTFATGLRSILRQDPDIIMLGEIRDKETADIAVRAATTGHKVLSTLHTNDAASTITRLFDMGLEPYLVASSLAGVVAQRLVRRICPQCKVRYNLEPESPWRTYLSAPPEQEVILYKGEGCSYCNNTGYRGRIAIQEVMPITKEMRQEIALRVTSDILQSLAREAGMITLKEDGIQKSLEGITTVGEVIRVAFSSDEEKE